MFNKKEWSKEYRKRLKEEGKSYYQDHKERILAKRKQDYPGFDNAPDIIESKSKDIPIDYQGLIAVPITFFKYYDYLPYEVLEHRGDLKLNGKTVYERLIIRRKQL